ncbi:MAG: hypothetical protein K9G62_08120 [Alphaproteobacteria bacterium]|nr:hypothetical protein [Alphaproteobacteria bacterium]
MTSVPAQIAAESALTKQNIALSVIKQSHEQDEKLVAILDKAARTAPLSQSRGTSVDVRA